MTTTTQRPVPTVRAIIADAEGRVLLLQRSAGSYGGTSWCLPGGKVDYGRTVEEAVIQEVLEETSLRCISVRFLFYQDSLPLETGGMHCINFYFECRTEGTVRLNPESVDYAWIGRDELSRYAIGFRNGEGLLRYWGQQL